MPTARLSSGPSRISRSKKSSKGGLSGLPLIEVDVSAGSEVQWLRDITTKWPIRANIQVCRPLVRRPSALLQVVELVGSPGDLEAAEHHLLHQAGMKEVSIVRASPSRYVVRGISTLPRACGLILRSGAVCTACRYLPGAGGNKRDRWSLVLPRSREVSQLVASLRDDAGEGGPLVYRSRSYRPEQVLTPRQAVAIETAYRLGFYAFPRRTNLYEISRILGISRPATAELLRRAEGKLLQPSLSAL